MNKIEQYILFFFLGVVFNGCDKPAPTELTDDSRIDVEVLSPDIDDEFYSNGFDSTGLAETPLRFTNIITLSAIKTDGRPQHRKSSFAQTIFFDRDFPVYAQNGKLLGYNTKAPGSVKFNNATARKEQYKIKFMGNNGPADTTLGFRFVLNGGRGMHSDPFDFDYGSIVKFEYNPENSDGPVIVNIPVPPEISASAAVTGSFERNNLSVLLQWNGNRSENFEVVISGINTRDEVVPLYRLITPDDGNLVIPPSLINM
ncbi:MAG: hypothetical protein R6W90_00715, partial [Ignavibacteriaceae bacterium]